MSRRFWLPAVAVVLGLAGSVRAADDVVLLGGKYDDAATLTLKGSASTAASTVEVFHGRILACLCHKHWGYSSSYSYGCNGCNGGCYGSGCYGSGCYGYGCYGYGCQGYSGQSYSPGYAAPAQSGPAATTYAAPAMGIYGAPRPVVPLPQPSMKVTVSTPRVDFSIGFGNGVIIGRTALASGRLFGPTDQPIDAPPSEPMPNPAFRGETLPTPRGRPGETFRYDGGPTSPVPMPGIVPARTHDDPRLGAPANRVNAPARQRLSYPAYGEPRTPPANPNVLVKYPA
ncbi:MAG TPA: hypothetical protein VL371_06025 [Gemmataceae bacterium]|jgi:hypothetical protein|nr:hypothetical protein [Gemmataceae bacterium]